MRHVGPEAGIAIDVRVGAIAGVVLAALRCRNGVMGDIHCSADEGGRDSPPAAPAAPGAPTSADTPGEMWIEDPDGIRIVWSRFPSATCSAVTCDRLDR